MEANTIEWVYYDSPYFIVPADDVGEEAFTVIREAMTNSNVVAISRLVIGGRERAVMLTASVTGGGWHVIRRHQVASR